MRLYKGIALAALLVAARSSAQEQGTSAQQPTKTLKPDLVQRPRSTQQATKIVKPAVIQRPLSVQQAIKTVKPAVVQLKLIVEDTTNPGTILESEPFATGFWADKDGHVITNAHVLEDLSEMKRTFADAVARGKEKGRLLLVIGVKQPEDAKDPLAKVEYALVGYTVTAIDRERDIAIIKAEPNPFRHPLLGGKGLVAVPQFDTSPLDDGEPIAASGFPLNLTSMLTTVGWISGHSFIPNRAYLACVTTNPGNSGGPVFRLSNGRIVGIAKGTISGKAPEGESARRQWGTLLPNSQPNSGLSIVIPIGDALDILRRQNK